MLANRLEQQDAGLDGTFAPDGEPDLTVHQCLIEIKARAFFNARKQAGADIEVVDEADLKMRNLAIGLIHPHCALQRLRDVLG